MKSCNPLACKYCEIFVINQNSVKIVLYKIFCHDNKIHDSIISSVLMLLKVLNIWHHTWHCLLFFFVSCCHYTKMQACKYHWYDFFTVAFDQHSYLNKVLFSGNLQSVHYCSGSTTAIWLFLVILVIYEDTC